MAGQELEDQRPGEPSLLAGGTLPVLVFARFSIQRADLRIGLLVRGSHLHASITVIDDIEASSFARIEMILLSPAPAQGRRTGTNPLVRPLRSMSDALRVLPGRSIWSWTGVACARRSSQGRGRIEPTRGIPVVRLSRPDAGASIRAAASTSSSTWALTRWMPIRATSSFSIAPFPIWRHTARGRFASEIQHPSEAGLRISRKCRG